MPGRLALSALVTLLVAQAGCATRLDFDSVSAGWDAARESGDELDAASTPTSDASAGGKADATAQADAGANDAGQAPLDAGHDRPLDAGAGVIADAAGHDAGGAALDAFAPMSDASVDPRTFSCARQTPAPQLCHDFEDVDDPNLTKATYVTPQEPTLAGSIGRDDHAARGGRGSLLATVNPQVPICSECELSVCAWWSFPEFQGHRLLTIDFDVRVDEVDPTPGHRSSLFRLSFGTAERGYSFHDLQLQSTGGGVEAAFVEFDRDGQAAGSSEPPTRGTSYGLQPWPGRLLDWVHVRYELDAVNTNASGNTVRVSVGNRLFADDELLVYSLRHQSPTLALGFPVVDMDEFVAGETNGSWQARFDNVLVRIEPR